MGRHKQYVETVVMHYPDGRSLPSAVIWEGETLTIDEVEKIDLDPEFCSTAYGIGIRYIVKIKNNRTNLYQEGNRFFVMMKE